MSTFISLTWAWGPGLPGPQYERREGQALSLPSLSCQALQNGASHVARESGLRARSTYDVRGPLLTTKWTSQCVRSQRVRWLRQRIFLKVDRTKWTTLTKRTPESSPLSATRHHFLRTRKVSAYSGSNRTLQGCPTCKKTHPPRTLP